MDRTRNVPDATVICRDINKLTDVAKSAIDHALEVLNLLPTPIPIDSKVYKSLEAIQGVPLESSSTKKNLEVGIQVDFLNRGSETIIEEAITCEDYELISVAPDKQLIPSKIETAEAIQDDVTKSDKPMEIEINYQEDATIEPKLIETLSKLKNSEDFKMELKKFEDNVMLLDKCAILLSKVKSEPETDIAVKETFSMKSCKSILKREEYSGTNDDTSVVSTDLSGTPDESVVIPNETQNSKDINESLKSVTEVLPEIKHVTGTVIEETMKHDKVNPQKSPDMMTNEEKTPTNSIPNRKITSIKDSILNLVKPKNYKPKLREDRIFVCVEDLKKCLQIAEKAMAEHNYEKVKRMTDKAKRIHAKSYVEPIATEAMEKSESLHNQAHTQSKRKIFDEASELTTKIKKAAKISTTEILQEEIIQAKNNDFENAMNMNTTDFDMCHKVDEAFSLIKQARIEIKEKNMKTAEQVLVQSITIHNTLSANELLNRKCESGSNPDNSIIDGDCLYESQQCIKLAENYMNENNFKKAEHFLKKSIHIAPSTEATKKLEKVQELLVEAESKQKKTIDRIEFEKYIELAWNAIAEENLKEAEKFIEKAEDMQPTENETKDMLVGLIEGLEDRKHEAYARRGIAFNEELLITCAETAIGNEEYDIAEVILTNAWIRHRSNKAIQMLLGQVATARLYGNKENKDWSNLKAAAEKYVKLIDNRWQKLILTDEMAQNVFCILIVAQNTYPTLRGKELMTKIRNIFVTQLYNKDRWTNYEWNYEKKTRNKQSFKCNSYVEMAERAYESGNCDIAKHFLEEAVKLIPARDIKQLMIQVEEAIKSKCWPHI